ncbi:MAG TPA: GAF domain-containing protein [Leptolyngbyaceae cyanobacterium M33_DOE_097]|uniref:histidine kinase n=1 Tax=Oscillatoriales cyanobacterium SpSt-418 TaxID=2282169 RepID=A0A7C3KBX1_9CYAN|nr:GAF domain-containing protein [Leptolyngbyaceae cyanobacterium M33_DOE_097]
MNELRLQAQRWEQQVLAAITRKQQGESEPTRNFERRKQNMDQIRQQIAAFIATEEQLRDQRSRSAQRTTQTVILTSLLLAMGVGIVLAYFIRRQILKISETYENALQVAQAQTAQAEQSATALERSAQRLAALHQIDRAILGAVTDEILIGNALTQLRQIVPHHHAFVASFDLETGCAQVIGGSCQTGIYVYPIGTQLRVADFAPEEALLRGLRYVENLEQIERHPPILFPLWLHGYRSCLCVPLIAETRLVGELNLASTETAVFGEEAQEIAQEVAAQLAIALQQTRLREQLQAYAAQLEQRVAERTVQLEATNQELEAFTYSVSHDLQAPLRTIQGFAGALLEDCGEQLEGYCRGYIDSIVDDAIQMNGLISDLLKYSRLTQAQIHLQPTDLDLMVDEALSQLLG